MKLEESFFLFLTKALQESRKLISGIISGQDVNAATTFAYRTGKSNVNVKICSLEFDRIQFEHEIKLIRPPVKKKLTFLLFLADCFE